MARLLIRFQVPAQISPERKNYTAKRQQSVQRTHYRIAHLGGLRGKIRFIESATQQGASGQDHFLSLILRFGIAWENQQKKKGRKYTGETISFHIRPPGFARTWPARPQRKNTADSILATIAQTWRGGLLTAYTPAMPDGSGKIASSSRLDCFFISSETERGDQ